MQSPATRLPDSAPLRTAPADIARKIVIQLKAFATQCPEYAGALEDCLEEISWTAGLGPAEAAADAPPPLKHGTNEIVTALSLWGELYPAFARSLRGCLDEIEETAERRVPQGEKVCARDVVLEAIIQGYATGPKIAQATGLNDRRVRRALMRLHHLRLIRCVGCGALSQEDGNRTRLWELTHTMP